MEQTQNYQLNLWAGEDRILREDFNADNMKTEQALSDHAALLANCGNCRIVTFNYTGTGTNGAANPTTLTFDAVPAVVWVIDLSDGHHTVLCPGQKKAYIRSDYVCQVSWNGTTVSWYSNNSAFHQCNNQGSSYAVVALLQTNAQE